MLAHLNAEITQKIIVLEEYLNIL